MSEFKTILIEKRKQLGLSQREMADYLHVTRQAISKWENGKGMPDMAFLPEISELLGVTVDELLTGKTPEKQIVEKVIVREKEVVKPIPASKILAIVLPILVVIIVASVLLGVYIPKALAPEPSPFLPEEPEPEITYTEVFIKGKSDTDDSNFQAPLINNKAYYGLMMQFSSEYTLYITAPKGAVATLSVNGWSQSAQPIEIDKLLIAEFDVSKTIEYSRFFQTQSYKKYENGKYNLSYADIYRDGDGESERFYKYTLILDMTNCDEQDCVKAKQQVVVRQHLGFDNITVPANETYVVAVPISKQTGANHYAIKSDGIKFVGMHILEQNYDRYSDFPAIGQIYTSPEKLLSDFYILNYEHFYSGNAKECDLYVGFINETDNDIQFKIDELPIEEIEFRQTVNVSAYPNEFASNNYFDMDDLINIYKVNIPFKMILMFKYQGSYSYGAWNMLEYFSSNDPSKNDIWYARGGYEADWNSDVYVTSNYIEPGEYYIIAVKDKQDYSFALDSWYRYDANRPK